MLNDALYPIWTCSGNREPFDSLRKKSCPVLTALARKTKFPTAKWPSVYRKPQKRQQGSPVAERTARAMSDQGNCGSCSVASCAAEAALALQAVARRMA